MDESLVKIIICAIAIGLGILLGNSAVYIFNHIPGKWLVDYGKEVDPELEKPTTQRIKSFPWKYIFSVFFVVCGIYLGIKDYRYAIPSLFAFWILIELSVSDIKYRIIPDQFVFLLAIVSVGLIPYHSVKDMIFGLIFGVGIMLIIFFFSKIVFKKNGIGGGDIKVYGAIGLMNGMYGVLFIFVLSTIVSAIHFGILLSTKKAKIGDSRPLIPYVAFSTMVYMLFFFGVRIHI